MNHPDRGSDLHNAPLKWTRVVTEEVCQRNNAGSPKGPKFKTPITPANKSSCVRR
ncbi:long-chain-fatty-acid--CoA ligase ACSBG2-like protein [Anopheles sinensis]|uniref:Long-chain-fatty-acid--CoA ligase ACSBG2-like protein n=1 Tax=Anopheles sinensis TaxID=74873 RepID=A0A084WS60_ANOSI|nr:long-chain-fatty-acid--CoA ligase ACSBG2-like protein [Anopheles sinensis]